MLTIIIAICEVPIQAGLRANAWGAKSMCASFMSMHPKRGEKEFSGIWGTLATKKSFLSCDYMQNTIQGPEGHSGENRRNNSIVDSLH